MIRIRLSRDVDNEFFIDDSFVNKNIVRIMKVELNGTILSSDDYMMKGPRKVKILRDLSPNDKVYAYTMNANLGNRIIPNMRF